MANFQTTAIVPSGAMTSTDTITSQVFNMNKYGGCSFQPVWSGTPTGTFEIQVSNDYVPNLSADATQPINPGTWTSLGATIPTNPDGSAGNTFVPIYASCAAYIRLSYTNSSGDGVLSGTFAGKLYG